MSIDIKSEYGSMNGIDCHIHVFGDLARYPATPERTYTPSVATFEQWQAISNPLGVQRAVLVQPSAYGTDNKRLLEGLRKAKGNARGIVVIDDSTPVASLETMHMLGVRGVRLNLVTGVSPDINSALEKVEATAGRIASYGWHLQLLASGALLEALTTVVPALPVPVVFDHMAGACVSAGRDQTGFEAALRLLRAGKCWMKISGADHVSTHRDAPEEALPIMRRLVEANSERLVWGSDWPHIGKAKGRDGVDYLPVDHAALLRLLREAAGSALSRQILVGNPEALYDWS